MNPSLSSLTIWLIAAATAGLILARPLRWPEAVWAVGGAGLTVVLGLTAPGQALAAVNHGLDVYLFLIGMMLLSETARREGLFDAAAALAVRLAGGSSARLFALVYAVGVGVTVLLSNDATAVVLTPAVLAVARKAKASAAPLLMACALVANAASFVLPISNPANLVVYGGRLPPLGEWLVRFALPSLLSVAVTGGVLFWIERRSLRAPCACGVEHEPLSAGGWAALAGLATTTAALLVVSGLGLPLGAPTCALGAATAGLACLRARISPTAILRGVSWSILPLVAGLFVLIEAVGRTGLTAGLSAQMGQGARPVAALAAGGAVALISNLVNNLPAGLLAGAAASRGHASRQMIDALMIGVDLGPNLSVTGSLATLLWLAAIRREGEAFSAVRFLKIGALAMPPALLAALAARLLVP